MANIIQMPQGAQEPPEELGTEYPLGTVLLYSNGHRYQLLRNTGIKEIGSATLIRMVQGYGVEELGAAHALKGVRSYGSRALELDPLPPGERGWFQVYSDHK